MLRIIECFAGAIWACAKSRRDLALENLGLRHQLAVLRSYSIGFFGSWYGAGLNTPSCGLT